MFPHWAVSMSVSSERCQACEECDWVPILLPLERRTVLFGFGQSFADIGRLFFKSRHGIGSSRLAYLLEDILRRWLAQQLSILDNLIMYSCAIRSVSILDISLSASCKCDPACAISELSPVEGRTAFSLAKALLRLVILLRSRALASSRRFFRTCWGKVSLSLSCFSFHLLI